MSHLNLLRFGAVWARHGGNNLLKQMTLSTAFSSHKLSSSAASGLLSLGRLNHVAIATPDLEKTSQFYRNLGANVSDAHEQKAHGVYTVFVDLGNTKIELLHPLGEKSPIQSFLDKNKNGGMHHICIEVANIETAMTEVKKRGIRCLTEKPANGAHNKPVVFLHPKDCGGVLIELEQE